MQTADQECDSKDLEGLTSTFKSRPSLNQQQQGCGVHSRSASTRQLDSADGLTITALSMRHKTFHWALPWTLADRVTCPPSPQIEALRALSLAAPIHSVNQRDHMEMIALPYLVTRYREQHLCMD